MQYRAEIDGLRGLAVVPVILFHGGFKGFDGGFVGVDVFFVISGYLITSIIFAEMNEGKFSLVNFYERRARRILPALFFVILLCVIPAYFFMLPDELENFGQSTIASILMSNNLLLAITSGYWGMDNDFKPLLHTWSLAVEEQYYLLFPLLLMLTWRWGKRWIFITLFLVFTLSLALAHWGSANQPIYTFFLLPTRAWEILLGAFCAFYFERKRAVQIPKALNEALGLIGLALIIWAIFAFDKNTPFPSLYALVPTAGTFLIILCAQQGTVVCRILSNKLIVGTGLVSYSAYLIHQPVFAFARLISTEPPGTVLLLCLIGLTFSAAYMSWKYVERPFRRGTHISSRSFIGCMVLAASISLASGLLYHTKKGFSESFYGETRYGESGIWQGYVDSAFTLKKDNFENGKELKILVIGNSYARDFVNILREGFDLKNIDIAYRDEEGTYDCNVHTGHSPYNALIMSADVIVFGSGHFTPGCIEKNIKWSKQNNIKVFYSGDKRLGYNLNHIKWKRLFLPKDDTRVIYSKDAVFGNNSGRQTYDRIPSNHFISLMDLISKNGLIRITDDAGRLLSIDRTHLTEPGAVFVGKLFHDDDNPLSSIARAYE